MVRRLPTWLRTFPRFFPAVAWASAIYILSAQPRLPTPPIAFEGLDKILHALVYAILAALLLLGDQLPRNSRAWRWAAVAIIYGATDEFHQSFIPNRSADLLDLVADSAGAIATVAVWMRAVSQRGPT